MSLTGLDPMIPPPWLPLRYRIALGVLRHLEAIVKLAGVTTAVGIGWVVGHH